MYTFFLYLTVTLCVSYTDAQWINNDKIFMASFQYNDVHLCAASFYSPRNLLSSCGCIYRGSFEITNLETEIHRYAISAYNGRTFQMAKVTALIPHPLCKVNSKTDTWQYNIGIIRVNQTFNPKPSYAFALLPMNAVVYEEALYNKFNDESYLKNGDKYCHAFTSDDTKYKSMRFSNMSLGEKYTFKRRQFQFLSDTDCRNWLCSSDFEKCKFDPIKENAYCAHAINQNDGRFCVGDSGSPFVCEGVVYGIVGWIVQCDPQQKVDMVFKLDIDFLELMKSTANTPIRIGSVFYLILFLLLINKYSWIH